MAAVLQPAALACTVLGLLAATAVLLRTRQVQLSLGVLLDFLLAAGLLRLSHDASGQAVATAAMTVLIRKLATFGLSYRGPRSAGAPSPPDDGCGGKHREDRLPTRIDRGAGT